MKTTFIILSILGLGSISTIHAQTTDNKVDYRNYNKNGKKTDLNVKSAEPMQRNVEYPEGNDKLKQRIADNLVFKDLVGKLGVKDWVTVEAIFKINSAGDVDAITTRSKYPELSSRVYDAASKAVVGKRFIPANINGQDVTSYITIPIVINMK